MAPDSFPKPFYINYRTMVLLAPIDGTQTGTSRPPRPRWTRWKNPAGRRADGRHGTKIVNLADRRPAVPEDHDHD
jgi:hypothetical protein